CARGDYYGSAWNYW
nr:immunoglobulin heavy chain junction region [Macaca mulatta]